FSRPFHAPGILRVLCDFSVSSVFLRTFAPFSSSRSPPSPRRVYVVHPPHFLRRLHRGDIQVHDHRLLPAAHHHALQRLSAAGIDLLVRHERRHVNEVTG